MRVMTQEFAAGAARWLTVETGELRGQQIKRRRVAFGLDSVSAFARMMIEREGKAPALETITKAEAGTASENTYLRLERFLDTLEEEAGYGPGEVLSVAEAEVAPSPVEAQMVTFHIGAIDVTVKGPVANLPELEAAVEKLLRGSRRDD